MRVCTSFFSNMDCLICQIQIPISRHIQIRKKAELNTLKKNTLKLKYAISLRDCASCEFDR